MDHRRTPPPEPDRPPRAHARSRSAPLPVLPFEEWLVFGLFLALLALG